MTISISTTLGAVSLKESWDTFEKGIDISQGPWVKLQYVLEDWTKSDAVINALMGSVAATTVGGAVTRIFPHACPESPNLVCLDARVKPQGEIDVRDSGRPRFNQALVQAHYGIAMRYDFDAGSNVSVVNNSFQNNDASGTDTGNPFVYAMQSIDFDTEVIKLPGSAYFFQTAPQLNVDVPVAMSIGTAMMVFTRKLVPYFPVSLITTKMNRLNTATFLGQPRGTVKFLKARTRREISSDGTRTQEIELVFKWREFDHNKIHRPDKRLFDIVQDINGDTMYKYTDLTPLLQ